MPSVMFLERRLIGMVLVILSEAKDLMVAPGSFASLRTTCEPRYHRRMLVHPQFDPIALDLSKIGIPIAVHWYGITYLVGFGLFLFLAARRARLPQFAGRGWTRRDIEDLLFFGVLGTGGRLGYVLFTSRASTSPTVRDPRRLEGRGRHSSGLLERCRDRASPRAREAPLPR
jgi:hypothetical protein